MIAPLAKFIDWCVLQADVVADVVISPRKCDKSNSKLTEAIEFLNGPNFIPAESKPAELEFTSNIHFKFQSPRPCEFAENNVVHGRLFRCADSWQKRPVIVLLHGAVEYLHYRFGFALLARHWNCAGFNVVTLESPYHFQRRPRQYGPLNIMGYYSAVVSSDYLRMAETFSQAIAEIRSLVGWLLAEGCTAVALAGGSLGAYLTGLTVCCDARLTSVIMITPPARQGNLLSHLEHVWGRRARELILQRRPACEELDKTPLNLSTSRPVISRENVLLIEGMYDLIVSNGPDEIWQSWAQPEIWRLPHNHVSWMFTPGINSRVLNWLTPRLKK